MDLKQLKQIAAILRNEKIDELEWKEGDFFLRLKRNSGQKLGLDEPKQSNLLIAPEEKTGLRAGETAQGPAGGPAPGNQYIVSPIVGTFYRAPSPKAQPYVKEGDKLNKGEVLCIIEAMKLMNELEAEFPCEIVRIIAQNAQPVEFNEPIFEVKPV
jgi:acetyl-CoA carboxylase biotin carboxyl carrier protein